MYATANGQTGLKCHPAAAAGGSASYVAFANVYNTTPVNCIEQDSNLSWTYSSASWRAANNNSNNSVAVVDPLGAYSATASYITTAGNNTAGQCAYTAITRNATSSADFGAYACAPTGTLGNNFEPFAAIGGWAPLQGYNVYYALESVQTGTTETYNAGGTMYLQVNAVY
jgi:hypothetical protein